MNVMKLHECNECNEVLYFFLFHGMAFKLNALTTLNKGLID